MYFTIYVPCIYSNARWITTDNSGYVLFVWYLLNAKQYPFVWQCFRAYWLWSNREYLLILSKEWGQHLLFFISNCLGIIYAGDHSHMNPACFFTLIWGTRRLIQPYWKTKYEYGPGSWEDWMFYFHCMKYSPSSWPPNFLPNTPHGLGCATTHSHQQDRQGYIKMIFRPCSYFGIIFSLNKHPEMEINPLKMVCGYPCGRVDKQKIKGHTPNPLTQWNALFNVQLHILCTPPPPPHPPSPPTLGWETLQQQTFPIHTHALDLRH